MNGQGAQGRSREYWNGMARGAGGAILFSLPMLMTMELWWLGFYANPVKLVLFLLLVFPVLVGLSRYSGLKPSSSWIGDVVDALSAYGIGFVIAAVSLFIFGVVTTSDTPTDAVGKIALEAVPGAIGAVLARSQMGQPTQDRTEQEHGGDVGYWGQLFLMMSGALYVGLSVAPTQEMVLIAFKMNAWRGALLAALSMLLLHAFVYALNFMGQEPAPAGTPWWSLLLRFTVVGYAIALLLSAYVLWTFGRFTGVAPAWIVTECVVLGFPAAVGAAAARLIL